VNRTQQWAMVTVLAVLAILVAGFMFLVKPTHKKADDLKSQAAVVETQTGVLRTKLTVLQTEQAHLKGELAKLAAIETKIPAAPDLPSLTRQLDAAAARTNIDLVNVAPTQPVAATAAGATTGTAATTGAQSMAVVLTVSGSYINLEQFLSRLEGLPAGLPAPDSSYLTRALLVDGFSVAYASTNSTSTSGATHSIGAGELTVTIQTRVFQTASPLGSSTSTTGQ
jgi:Tfp pilus assembly protein PilO